MHASTTRTLAFAALLAHAACSGTEAELQPMPMAHQTTPSRPPIDAEAPAAFQTATFALG